MKRTLASSGVTVFVAVAVAMMPAADTVAQPRQAVAVAELTPQAEAAIKKGLAWLAKSQHGDGSWGRSYKVASTALSLMAFMVQGQFPERGPNGERLSKAVDYLLRENTAHRGYMGRSMYEHGLATLALSEVWGMSNRDEIRDALKRAVSVILRSQNPAGGWRYNPQPRDADMSVTVMQVVALASAKEAGIFVPDETIDKAIKYVLYCQEKTSGGFGYTGPSGPNLARSAAGVVSLMMCGQRDSDAVKRGLAYLMKQPDNVFAGGGHFHYAHYYAAQGMYQAGDKYYQKWYPKIRDALLKQQTPAGSWPGGHGIETQMSILILGIPYRFLPIYQR